VEKSGEGSRSAIEEIEEQHSLKVISIITLAHLIQYLEACQGMADF